MDMGKYINQVYTSLKNVKSVFLILGLGLGNMNNNKVDFSFILILAK